MCFVQFFGPWAFGSWILDHGHLDHGPCIIDDMIDFGPCIFDHGSWIMDYAAYWIILVAKSVASVPTLPPWSGAKGQRGSRPLMREYLPRSHGHGPYQERPPDPPQAPRVLDDSDVGWVDVAGRPFPRVAPAAIGRRPIASTMHGTVHSMASMGLEGYAGAKGAGGARKNPSSKGKCGAKGGRTTDRSFSHTVSLEQTLPPQTGWLDQSCPAPAVFDGRQDKGSARSAFPPRPPGVMETPPREL